ncbi:conserved hypothetical protein [delta proteobacterium NaphS2]|nr:conserved hypothetical protein [delta proteobacterium NaphS2]
MGVKGLKAVIDAGPLIHLSEIGCLHFLNSFDELHVPEAVWLETVGQDRVFETELSSLKNMQRHSFPEEEVERFVRRNNLSRLHAGELECLFGGFR